MFLNTCCDLTLQFHSKLASSERLTYRFEALALLGLHCCRRDAAWTGIGHASTCYGCVIQASMSWKRRSSASIHSALNPRVSDTSFNKGGPARGQLWCARHQATFSVGQVCLKSISILVLATTKALLHQDRFRPYTPAGVSKRRQTRPGL